MNQYFFKKLIAVACLAVAQIILFPYNINISNIIIILLNLYIVIIVFSVIDIFIKRNNLSLLCSFSIFVIIYWINELVYNIRHTYISYSDLLSIKDAFNVANGYSMTISMTSFKNIIIAAIPVLLFLFLDTIYMLQNSESDNIIKKIFDKLNYSNKTAIITDILLLFLLTPIMFSDYVIEDIKDDNNYLSDFNLKNVYDTNGFFYTIYVQFLNSKIEIREGYSRKEFEKNMITNENMTYDEPINIIVIMNESFTDYTEIGKTHFQNDPLKNIHEMLDNGELVHGRMYSSVYAGGTCNSEFEFLTGIPIRFFPVNSYPYIMYINDDIYTLADYFSNLDFHTCAIHPYYAGEWNRNTVYSYMGFDDFISGEDFQDNYTYDNTDIFDIALTRGNFGSGLEYFRGFISDRECYRKILEQLHSSDSNKFIFTVTIHNHGSYGIEPYANNDIFFSENHNFDDYLNGIAKSDKDFKWLLDELAKMDKNTVVLMFGDHQPGLEISEIKTNVALPEEYDDISSGFPAESYVVPYYLWSNYDVEWTDVPDDTCASYLSHVLKKNIGLPYDSMDYFLEDIMRKYPVITQNYFMNSSGTPYNGNVDDKLILDYSDWRNYLFGY